MDYSLYEMIITKRLIYFLVLGVAVIIIGIFAMIYIRKNMQQDRVIFLILTFLCSAIIIGSITLTSRVAISSIHDIKNQAYIFWYGEFVVERDVETRSGTCTLYLIDKDLKLEVDAYLLEPGNYEGMVVYGEKTEIVLEIKQNTP